MNKRIFTLVGVLAIGVALGFGLTQLRGDRAPTAATPEKKILYWTDPMLEGFKSDKPGKSPMGMEMVPVYEGEEPVDAAAEPALAIDPAVVNRLGVRTEKAIRGDFARAIDTVGYVALNDDRTSQINVRSEGWIEKLAVRSAGGRVKRGDLLFQLYSRPLANAQAEYLQAIRLGQAGFIAAARQRLIALGMSVGEIDALAKRGKAGELIGVRAPQDGIVAELNVAEGAFVTPGTTVMRLSDLAVIWVIAEIFEDQAAWLADGQRAVMRLAAMPGRSWEGSVDYIYPTVDPASRTVRVRLEFQNPDESLKPGMYTELSIAAASRDGIVSIPTEALIRTGAGARVILALGEGRFRPAAVTPGVEANGRVEILSGLAEGETVVTSAQFLIDSEASLDASLLRLGAVDQPRAAKPDSGPSAMAEIKGIELIARRINLAHEPISALGWPAMTMDFQVTEAVDLAAVTIGDHVRFSLERAEDGTYAVIAIERMEP